VHEVCREGEIEGERWMEGGVAFISRSDKDTIRCSRKTNVAVEERQVETGSQASGLIYHSELKKEAWAGDPAECVRS